MQRRKLGTVVAVLVAAALVGVGISRLDPTAGTSSSVGMSVPAGTKSAAVQAIPGSASGGSGGAVGIADIAPVPAIGPQVIRTGQLTLAVKPGSLRARLDAIGALAQRFGGYVASSQSSDIGGRSGQAVVRIPAARFQTALVAIERLGSVRDESVSGRDVTSQVVDLHARLVNAEAQRQVLLRLMTRATTIAGSIAVENQLQAVELSIEELQGELRQLSNQTSLATITVDLMQNGTPKAAPAGTLGGSFGRSVRAAEHVVAAVVVGLGYVVPIGVSALAVYGCWRALRRLALTRRPASAGPPAGEAQS